MTTWIAIGSGPSADSTISRAQRENPAATTISTNSAAMLLRPDYYFLSDFVACQRWGAVALAYQELGTKLVTLSRQTDALKDRGVDCFDIFVDFPNFVYSGLFIVGWAARQAEKVCLVGYDGYRSTPDKLMVDYFDGRLGNAKQALQNHTVIRPGLTQIAKAFPEVLFVQYREPLYGRIEAPNWETIP